LSGDVDGWTIGLSHGGRFSMENSQIRGLTGGTLRPQGDAGVPSVASDKTLPLRDVRILVADDDALSLEVTRLTLMSRGAQVDMAGSGLLAIEKTAAFPYDALLIDERMPSMLGSEAIKRIRARPEGDKICIVAMVSRSDAAAGERVIAAGANGCLAKPVSPRHLLETIIGCIGERKPHRAKQEQKQESRVAQAPQEFAELQSMDVGAAIARLGGNAGLYRQTLLAFVRSHTDGVAEIRTSLLQCDGALAHRQSHTLKGICGTIGAQDLFPSSRLWRTRFPQGHCRTLCWKASMRSCLPSRNSSQMFAAMLPRTRPPIPAVRWRRCAVTRSAPH
jgi:CheY-like chemotaxis protein